MWTRRTLLASGLAVLADEARAADEAPTAHSLALREAARLQARADVLLRGQGLTRGSVGDRLRTLWRDPRWLYPDSDAGRDRAVAEMNARLAALRPRLAQAFGDLPLPTPQVRRPTPENEAKGGYREPPVYYVDLRTIRARPAWTLPTVAFHETVPGHALQASVPGAPKPAAFSEAWAVYAEQLAADLGAYAHDPRGEIGYLQWRLFRVGRIVADTGLSAVGWSADRAVAALGDLQGFPAAFVTFEADVARMRRSPGVYAAQGLSALAIARARPRRRAYWPAFHRAMLADGPGSSAMLPQRAGQESPR